MNQGLSEIKDNFAKRKISGMSSSSNELMIAALGYAAQGNKVLPLHYVKQNGHCSCKKGGECSNKAKHPITEHGLKDASADTSTITKWWNKNPKANIGLSTGENLVVIDVDGPDGRTLLQNLETKLGKLPPTKEVTSGRTDGGRHLYFHKDTSLDLRNVNGKDDMKGIDVRANGGYIIAPPSVHYTGRQYKFVNEDVPIATLPEAWVNHFSQSKALTNGNGSSGSGKRRLSAPADNGERNDSLIRYAGLLEAQNLDKHEIIEKCHQVNSTYSPPLAAKEVEGRVDSIWRYRINRHEQLKDLIQKFTDCSNSTDRLEIVTKDERHKDLLHLAKMREPVTWSRIQDLFKGKKKDLKNIMGDAPKLSIVNQQQGDQILSELPGVSVNTFPGDFSGFPVVQGYLYQNTNQGVCLFLASEDNLDLVSTAPVFITKRLAHKDHAVYLQVCWLERNDWASVTEIRSTFMDARLVTRLADRGFPVSSATSRAIVQYLQKFEATFRDMIPEQNISNRMGWHNGSFLIGKDCLSSDVSPKIDFQAADTGEQSLVDALSTRGTYDGWLHGITPAMKFPLPSLALNASFSAPLVGVLGVPNYGLDLSCRTSTGKTTILRTSASPYGQPDEANGSSMTHTWDTTVVGAERLCSILCDLPVILDDTKRQKPDRVGSILYGVIHGHGRMRGSKTGSQRTASWRTVLISSGEAAAISYTQDAGARARLLTLRGNPFGKEPQPELVNAINFAVKNNYGHAGRMWIQWLIENEDQWPRFKERHIELAQALKPTSEVESRLADSAAVIQLAGELVHRALNFPWRYHDPISIVWDSIKSEAKEIDIHIRGARAIYDWAVAHQNSFWGCHKISKHRDSDGEPIEPTGGWAGKWEKETGSWEHISFIPSQLKKIMKELGFDYEAVRAGLVDSEMAWGSQPWINGDRIRVLTISKEALTVNETDYEYPGDWDDN